MKQPEQVGLKLVIADEYELRLRYTVVGNHAQFFPEYSRLIVGLLAQQLKEEYWELQRSLSHPSNNFYAALMRAQALRQYEDEIVRKAFLTQRDRYDGFSITIEKPEFQAYYGHNNSLEQFVEDLQSRSIIIRFRERFRNKRLIVSILRLVATIRAESQDCIARFCGYSWSSRPWFVLHGSHPPKTSDLGVSMLNGAQQLG